MDAGPSAHPTVETLQAFGLRKLDDASAEVVSNHLEVCLECRRHVAEITAVSPTGPSALPSGITLADDSRDSSSSPAMSSTGQADVTSDASKSPDDASFPSGTRVGYFGDYEMLKVLGEGGMGVVYKARQLSLNRPVALKMIKAARFPSPTRCVGFRTRPRRSLCLTIPASCRFTRSASTTASVTSA